MTLAWRVATDESPEMRAVRENVILVLLPTINPDGLDKVVDWYRHQYRVLRDWTARGAKHTPGTGSVT
jgi:murein tripeptide amidase MpaA